VKPIIEHDIGNGPEAIVADPDSLITSRGSADVTNVAEPKARPNWCVHLTSSVAVKLPKKTPAMEIIFIEPLDMLLGKGFGDTKDTVIATLEMPLTTEERATETATASPAKTTRVVPTTVATLAPFVNVTSTDDAAAGVPAPITTTTVVALAYVHVAEVPELGVAPTFAVHANPAMKLVPVTVMVLLA
jgi:hypothetical protein